MKCATCHTPFSFLIFLLIHWKQTGCQRRRPVWERVAEAKRRGTSGKRILHAAFPETYKTKPMPEEVKALWRERQAGGAR